MRLDELVAWYQKKIGTYDKQQWEKTIEQKILAGINHLPLKNTKLKTELIDVDLVRGSTFPKAKSKLSILTVIYLAALRLLLLPIYARWWVQQTSPRVFVLLLALYLLQMINLGIYSYNVNKTGADQEEHIVSMSDFLIPMALSLLLSVIHSQIVATGSHNNSLCLKMKKCRSHSTLKKRERIRRKRRARMAQPGSGESTTTTATTNTSRPSNEDPDPRTKAKGLRGSASRSPSGSPARTAKKQGACSTSSSTSSDTLATGGKANCGRIDEIRNLEIRKSDLDLGSPKKTINGTVVRRSTVDSVCNDSMNNECDIANAEVDDDSVFLDSSYNNETTPAPKVVIHRTIDPISNDLPTPDPSQPGCSLRRRKVNWGPQIPTNNTNAAPAVANLSVNQPEATVDDDGFESLNGKSSGGEDSSNAGGSSETYYNKKLPYTNTWINGIEKDTRSDSDTDTLRNTPTSTSHEQCGGSLPQATSNLPPGKPRRHLSSESGIELQRHDRSKSPLLLLDDSATNCGSVDADGESKGSGFDENLESSGDTDEENDFDLHQTESSHHLHHHAHHHSHHHHLHHQHLSEGEECSYSSDLNHSDGQNEHSDDDYDLEDAPTIILNPPCGATDRVSCTIWDAREAKKAEMSVLDISSAIIERVEAMPETCDYVYIGVVLSIILSLIPAFCRLCEATVDSSSSTELNFLELPVLLLEKASFSCIAILRFAFGESNWEKTVLVLGFIVRLCLTYLVFFLLAVAERTFKQRFLYAKLFSHLTSSRRAQKSGIPHFRLNKVRNIKTWLCVRSYLKRRGPQNSVDVIVSAAFIITLLLLAFLSVEWLKDSVHLHSQFNLEALVWSCAFGTFLLRFMTLGTKINKKYKSVSVLITEQINLYVQIEQKPNKKEELMISNNVLKLAADLLKELESPFKISGLSANPYLYTTVKVVILSALSGVLSEMLGFKLKLHKIKIK
ncbi:protein phtf isoform X2 [Aedes albopictus]|uniref:PHTF1/2 N-terminal domain-containing protein n=1 Tax=Aedes albopictus TaxID=7160 RepID=A0ABM1YZX6_AEDAL